MPSPPGPGSAPRAGPSSGVVTTRRPLWSLLVYGVLGVIALARRPGRPTALALHRPWSGFAGARDEPSGEAGDGGSRKHEQGDRQRSAPWDIPWSDWKDIFWRVYQKLNEDRLLAVAAGAVFYSLLALFPAVAAFVSLYGLFADASTIDQHLSIASGILPGGAVDIVHEQLTRLASNGSKLGFGFVIGLAFALWSANAGMKAMIDALNVAYEVKEKRSVIRLNLVSLAFTLVAILTLMLAFGVVVVAPVVLSQIGLQNLSSTLFAILRWPTLLGLVITGLAALYRYAPCRHEPRWQWLSVGSVLAAVLWLNASLVFSWYIDNFGTYNVTYGSLGAAVGMMMWMWISTSVILLGAQLNSEIAARPARAFPTVLAGSRARKPLER